MGHSPKTMVATSTENGFMSAADKDKLDGIPPGGGGGASVYFKAQTAGAFAWVDVTQTDFIPVNFPYDQGGYAGVGVNNELLITIPSGQTGLFHFDFHMIVETATNNASEAYFAIFQDDGTGNLIGLHHNLWFVRGFGGLHDRATIQGSADVVLEGTGVYRIIMFQDSGVDWPIWGDETQNWINVHKIASI